MAVKFEPDTIKVVINDVYGGFGLSAAAISFMNEKANEYAFTEQVSKYTFRDSKKRHHPLLIEAIEALGTLASDKYSKLIIEEIPKIFENHYKIIEYDGLESIEYDINTIITEKVVNYDPVISSLDPIDFINNMKTLYEQYSRDKLWQ